MCLGSCINCNTPISFNPTKVPSLRVKGVREPICRDCHAMWNEIHRISKGLEAIPVDPQAYEPEPEML